MSHNLLNKCDYNGDLKLTTLKLDHAVPTTQIKRNENATQNHWIYKCENIFKMYGVKNAKGETTKRLIDTNFAKQQSILTHEKNINFQNRSASSRSILVRLLITYVSQSIARAVIRLINLTYTHTRTQTYIHTYTHRHTITTTDS